MALEGTSVTQQPNFAQRAWNAATGSSLGRIIAAGSSWTALSVYLSNLRSLVAVAKSSFGGLVASIGLELAYQGISAALNAQNRAQAIAILKNTLARLKEIKLKDYVPARFRKHARDEAELAPVLADDAAQNNSQALADDADLELGQGASTSTDSLSLEAPTPAFAMSEMFAPNLENTLQDAQILDLAAQVTELAAAIDQIDAATDAAPAPVVFADLGRDVVDSHEQCDAEASFVAAQLQAQTSSLQDDAVVEIEHPADTGRDAVDCDAQCDAEARFAMAQVEAAAPAQLQDDAPAPASSSSEGEVAEQQPAAKRQRTAKTKGAAPVRRSPRSGK